VISNIRKDFGQALFLVIFIWKAFYIITGGVAGICAKTVTAPIERVKIIYIVLLKIIQ
jgi:hypothetical protein